MTANPAADDLRQANRAWLVAAVDACDHADVDEVFAAWAERTPAKPWARMIEQTVMHDAQKWAAHADLFELRAVTWFGMARLSTRLLPRRSATRFINALWHMLPAADKEGFLRSLKAQYALPNGVQE